MTLLLYFKHSPALTTGHFHFPLSSSLLGKGRRKSRRTGKNPLLFPKKGRERGGATVLARHRLLLPQSLHWFRWVRKPRRTLLLGRENHRTLCSDYTHIWITASPTNLPWSTCQNSYSQEAQEVSTISGASFPLSMILHVCKLTLSSFSRFVKGFHFELSKQNLN